jgi:glycosyltransferase involved in cell wall biosynthesis
MASVTTAVSACFVRPGQVGGAEYALYNLLDGFRQLPAAQAFEVVTATPLPIGFAPLTERRVDTGRLRNRIAIETVSLPVLRGVDRWLLPNYYTPVGLRGQVVTVIHDCQYAHFPANFSTAKRRWLAAAHRYTLRRASTVIAISAFVADDLVGLHGERFAPKIRVIPNAVSFDRLEGGALPSGVPTDRELVLCVAANYRHKNLPMLVRAFSDVARRRPDAHLVLVGQSPENLLGARHATGLDRLIDALGLRGKISRLGHISDPELGALYRAATVLAMPSLFEGFGLPVVEALGLGLPVVSSAAGSLRDVGLGLPILVDDPTDGRVFADYVVDVLTAPKRCAVAPLDSEKIRNYYSPLRVAREFVEVMA